MRSALDVLVPATVWAILYLIVLFLFPTLGLLAAVGMMAVIAYRLTRSRA